MANNRLKKKKKSAKSEEKDTERCTQCKTDVNGDEIEALACEICEEWICRACIKIPTDVYRFLEENTEVFPYICKVCTPKLPEMKDFVELKKSHVDLQKKVEGVESKQNTDNTRLAAIELQMGELTKANENQTKVLDELNKTLSEMKATSLTTEGFPDLLTANPPQAFIQMISERVQPTLRPMINTEISERDQIEGIKHNLIISGMVENTAMDDDKTKFVQLIKDEMDLIVEVESAERLNRKEESASPKLLRVVFNCMKTRKVLLSKATTLRQSANEHVKRNVYIRPELTKKQLEESKNLTITLRAKRQENPNKKYKIYRGNIIEVNLQNQENIQ